MTDTSTGMVEHYRFTYGKFGAYFVDEETGGEMTLKEVVTALNDLRTERNALQATNAELLEALKAWAEFDALPLDAKRPDIFEIMVLRKTRAAISKAEGKI